MSLQNQGILINTNCKIRGCSQRNKFRATYFYVNNVEEYSAKINNHLHEWSFDRLGYVEQAILLLAASELETGDLDRAIIVNEAIELTKKYCDDAAYKLINGVLDKYE